MKLTAKEHGPTIKKLLAEGYSYRGIASELGCSHVTVSAFAQLNFPDLRRATSSNQHGQREEQAPPVSDVKLKILVIDIETRPNLAYVWGVWDQNIRAEQLVDEKEVMCFAAKWLGASETKFYSTYGVGQKDMVKAAWRLLDEADAVIHYNGKRFDIPHLNLEFLRSGLTPPSPFRQIDLLMTVKREFKFTSNKLTNVADKLGIGQKMEHEGFGLWLKCLAGDDDAWQRMMEYNVQDVLLTEKLYYELLPWITNHPSHSAILGDKRCPNCGSERLENKGWQYTKTRKYQRYRCRACGKYCRDTHCISSGEITETSSW